MKTNKMITFFVLIICVLVTLGLFNNTTAKVKVIRLYKGETYSLKLKKTSKITSSNKRIAAVNKKGKIKARKKGKCIIRVTKGTKTARYKVIVKNKNSEADKNVDTGNATNKETDNSDRKAKIEEYLSKSYSILGFGIHKVYDITEKDEMYYCICFVEKDVNPYTYLYDQYNVKYIKVDIPKSVFNNSSKPIKIGDNASFHYRAGKGKWIVKEDTLYISELEILSINNETREEPTASMPPTNPPVEVS